ncbi:hypothetical protein C8J57DRAFT_1282249 [Mycena rebaudengoi]|nr:hypothetical protein C8J57DRAFT_1282249 [Mycena rebaudengoi]
MFTTSFVVLTQCSLLTDLELVFVPRLSSAFFRRSIGHSIFLFSPVRRLFGQRQSIFLLEGIIILAAGVVEYPVLPRVLENNNSLQKRRDYRYGPHWTRESRMRVLYVFFSGFYANAHSEE